MAYFTNEFRKNWCGYDNENNLVNHNSESHEHNTVEKPDGLYLQEVCIMCMSYREQKIRKVEGDFKIDPNKL